MKESELIFTTLSEEKAYHTRVFDVKAKHCSAENGLKGDYFVIDAPEWVVTIPVKDGDFLLVRQWRHGAGRILTEFPGGVIEPGEDPAEAARRETEEETGHRIGKLTFLGTVSPNPALFTNRFHVYLAEDLIPVGEQKLDEDEFLNLVRVPIGDLLRDYGTGEYLHAFMGTALAFYLRHEAEKE